MLKSLDCSEGPDEWFLRLRDETLGNAFETNLTSVGLAGRDDDATQTIILSIEHTNANSIERPTVRPSFHALYSNSLTY